MTHPNDDAFLRLWIHWEPNLETAEVAMSYRIDRVVTELITWGYIVTRARTIASMILQRPRIAPNPDHPDPALYPMDLVVEWIHTSPDEIDMILSIEYTGDQTLAWTTIARRVILFADILEKTEDPDVVTPIAAQPGALALIKGGLSDTSGG